MITTINLNTMYSFFLTLFNLHILAYFQENLSLCKIELISNESNDGFTLGTYGGCPQSLSIKLDCFF